MNYSQPNVALQLVNALVKRDESGEDELSAHLLAEDVSPKFPDVPLPVLRIIAAKALALFYEPLTRQDIDGARLNVTEREDACEFLSFSYRAEAELLASMTPAPTPQ